MPRLLSQLQLRKNHGITSVRVTEKCQMGTICFVDREALAAATDCKHQHSRLAPRMRQVNPRSAQIPAQLPN